MRLTHRAAYGSAPIVEATIENFAQIPKQTKVVIEGYLKLSSSTHCEEQCNLFLLDYLNSENTLVIFITLTPKPQEPTPFPADYANIQALKDDCLKLAEKNQLGRISGTLHVSDDVFCNKSRFGRTCSIYLQDSSGETLYFDAWEVVHFDPIPENYTSASIHLRAEDDQSIPEGGKVTILMSVSNLLDPNQCLYYPQEINLQP